MFVFVEEDDFVRRGVEEEGELAFVFGGGTGVRGDSAGPGNESGVIEEDDEGEVGGGVNTPGLSVNVVLPTTAG